MLTILQGDVIERLADIASDSIHCVVTSVPYYGLRDYGTATWEGGQPDCSHAKDFVPRSERNPGASNIGHGGATNDAQDFGRNVYRDACGKCGAIRVDQQIGLEKTPAEYIAKMVQVFAEVRRVLRPDGTLWLNIGDSYARMQENNVPQSKNPKVIPPSMTGRLKNAGLKPKDLCMMPARLAIALCDDGWYLRSEIVWSKPNPMPESVTDRPTRSHEMVYLLTKRANYFYDAEAIKEPNSSNEQLAHNQKYAKSYQAYDSRAPQSGQPGNINNVGIHSRPGSVGRNRRSVWTIATQPTPDAHFATFPEALVEPCILAGTSARGCCSECGAPYKRILEPTQEYAKLLGHDWSDQEQDDAEGRGHFALSDGGQSAQRPVKRNAPSVCAEYVTKGWQAGCGHNAPVIHCTVLDPFFGSGTTGKVALNLGRKCVGIELNAEYIRIAEKKTQTQLGLLMA